MEYAYLPPHIARPPTSRASSRKRSAAAAAAAADAEAEAAEAAVVPYFWERDAYMLWWKQRVHDRLCEESQPQLGSAPSQPKPEPPQLSLAAGPSPPSPPSATFIALAASLAASADAAASVSQFEVGLRVRAHYGTDEDELWWAATVVGIDQANGESRS